MVLGPPRASTRSKVGGDSEPEVFCADEQSDVEVDVARWQELARRVLIAEGVRGGTELSVFFVDRGVIADLNAEHMGVDGPTDVLAFPIDGGDVVETVAGPTGGTRGPDRPPFDRGDLPLLLGDVVVCPSVAVEQAPRHAGTTDDEIALLVVHGTLHVLGWDHHDEITTSRMRSRERELLEAHHWMATAPEAFRREDES